MFSIPKKERIQHLFFAYLCLLGFPAFFVVSLFAHEMPSSPLSSDQWTCVVLAPVTLALGFLLLRFTGHYYVFDGSTIRQYTRSGRLWREVEIQQVIAAEVNRLKGGTMLLRTERVSMGVGLSSDLRKEIQRVANLQQQKTLGGVPSSDG